MNIVRGGFDSHAFPPVEIKHVLGSAGLLLVFAVVLALTPPGSAQGAGASAPDTSSKGFLDIPFFVMMRSAVIPGWGQFHNHKYLKGGAVLILEGSLGFMIYKEDKKTRDYYRKHLDVPGLSEKIYYYDLYSLHYERRSNFIWWLAGATIFSLVDAYVDAHLKGFDEEVGRETSVEIAFMRGSQNVLLGLRKTF